MTLLTLNPLARRSPLYQPATVECAVHAPVEFVRGIPPVKRLGAQIPVVTENTVLIRRRRGRPIRDYHQLSKSLPYEQAARILGAFGGPAALKAAMYQCGAYRNLTSIYRWLLPHADGGSDGRVPRQSHRDVWRAAIAADLHKSLGITHEDWGLDISPFHPKRIRNHGFKNNAGRQPGRRSPVVPTQIKASTQIKATT